VAEVSGFLNINKPSGMTSHDVVAKLRRGLRIKKIGHAGTLDPMATGVLVICIGQATRLSEYVMQSVKCYRARIRLGIVTDTYDLTGAVLQEKEASHIQRSQVEQALSSYTGDINQIPPMYSAIKQGGRKLYELARAGQIVERAARAVHIESITAVEWALPEVTVDVVCSAGTYIRSLAYDIGEKLGVGAHLSALTRMSSGVFHVAEAISPDSVLLMEDWSTQLVMPSKALQDKPAISLNSEELEHIIHGRPITAHNRQSDLVFSYRFDGKLIAILQYDSGLWRPHKVFSDDSL